MRSLARAGSQLPAPMLALLKARATILMMRYGLVSAAAACLDVGVFLLLLSADVLAVPASVAGYLCGTQLHWLLSTRFVFAHGVRNELGARRAQQAMFFASAVVGLVCNAGIIAASVELEVPLLIGKLVAIVTCFVLVLAMRAMIVFSHRRA